MTTATPLAGVPQGRERDKPYPGTVDRQIEKRQSRRSTIAIVVYWQFPVLLGAGRVFGLTGVLHGVGTETAKATTALRETHRAAID